MPLKQHNCIYALVGLSSTSDALVAALSLTSNRVTHFFIFFGLGSLKHDTRSSIYIYIYLLDQVLISRYSRQQGLFFLFLFLLACETGPLEIQLSPRLTDIRVCQCLHAVFSARNRSECITNTTGA